MLSSCVLIRRGDVVKHSEGHEFHSLPLRVRLGLCFARPEKFFQRLFPGRRRFGFRGSIRARIRAGIVDVGLRVMQHRVAATH